MQYAKSVKEPLLQGRMVDLSSQGAAFLCIAGNNCPKEDELLKTCFSVPRFDSDKTFDSTSYRRIGRVCRVDNVNNGLRRIALQFAKPLPFRPGEQNISRHDRIYNLATKVMTEFIIWLQKLKVCQLLYHFDLPRNITRGNQYP
jgi:hypothetical protein